MGIDNLRALSQQEKERTQVGVVLYQVIREVVDGRRDANVSVGQCQKEGSAVGVKISELGCYRGWSLWIKARRTSIPPPWQKKFLFF